MNQKHNTELAYNVVKGVHIRSDRRRVPLKTILLFILNMS